MKSGSQIYALFLMLVFYTSCRGQNQTNHSKENIKSETQNVTTPYGPKNIARNIVQDRKGNIWIAAFDGIFRYDGKSFTNVTGNVSSAPFFSVLEDRKGNLWFGSIGSGAYYYDGKSFRNFTTKNGLAGNNVGCIYEDKAGNIWFGTQGGISRYDGRSFRNYTMKEGLPNNDINTIVEDKTGKFWFGTRDYACSYDGKRFTVLTHGGKPFTNIRTIIEDKKGNIWLGGNGGLWRYGGNKFTNFTQSFVGYIIEDKKGNIWISSEKDNSRAAVLSSEDFKPSSNRSWALYRYDGTSLSYKNPTVKEIESQEQMICGILEAKDGSIWFGAYGVYRYDGNTITDFKDKEVGK